MKGKLSLLTLALGLSGFLLCGQVSAQTDIINEDFDDSTVTYTPSVPEFSDGSGDFFGRVDSDGISVTSAYSVSGATDGYFAAMDTDGDGNPAEVDLTWSGLDITNNTSVTFSIDLAEDDDGSAQDWDDDTSFRLEASTDGGSSWTPFFAVEAVGGTNSEPAVDTNLDGIGNGATITDTFATFTGTIPDTTGETTLSVRMVFDQLEAGDEDIAVENFVVTLTTGAPTPTIVVTATAPTINENTTDADLIQVSLANASGATFPLDVSLSSSPTGEVTLNGSAAPTIQFSSESDTIDVSVAALDDPDSDGDFTVTITAAAAGFTDGTASFDVIDDDVSSVTVIAVEDFDGGTPAWTNDASVQTFVDPSSSDQGLFIQTSSAGLLNNGTNVLFGRDLNNETGEPALNPVTIVFDEVDVALYSGVEISFDYALNGFDAADEVTFTVVINEGLPGENLSFATGTFNGSDTGTQTVAIPNGTTTVGLVLVLDQDGAADDFELDNFQVTGTLGSVPAILLSTTAPSVDEGATDADLVQVALVNASGQTFPLDVTLTADPASEVTLNGVVSPTVQFANDSQTIDVSVEGTEDADFTGDVTVTITGTASGLSNGTTTFDVIDNDTPSIVINEIMFDPNDGSTTFDSNGDGSGDTSEDEFVELVNTGASAIDISGWVIEDAAALRHTFPASTVLAPNQAIIVFGGGTPTGFVGILTQTASTGFLGFNNSGNESVILKDDQGALVAQVDYNGGGDGVSITRDPDLTGGTFVDHDTATGSGGARASVGTTIDGNNFDGSSASPVIILTRTASSIDEGATDADLLQLSLQDASGLTYPLDVTLTSSPSGKVTLNGAVSPAITFNASTNTFDVSVEGLEDADFTGDVSVTVTATGPQGLVDGSVGFSVADNELEVIFTEDFETDLGSFEVVDLGDLDATWIQEGGYALGNGFGEDATEDWLITPALQLGAYSNEQLDFNLEVDFEGSDLTLLYSSDYDGLGDPTTATWITLATYDDTSGLGNPTDLSVDVSSISDSLGDIHFAFRYTGNGPNPGQSVRARLYEFTARGVLTGQLNPSISLTSTAATIDEGATDADLIQVALADASGLTFPLDVTLNSSPAGEVTLNGVASPTVQFASASDTFDVSVVATEDTDFTGDVVVTITATGAGLDNGTASFDVVDNDGPSIVINEILFDPDDGVSVLDANGDGSPSATDDEFVELVNTGVSSLDISNWTLEDGASLRHTFPAATVLSPSQAIIIFGGGTPTGFTGPLTQVASSGALGLNNGGDTVTLKDDLGATVAVVTYTGTSVEGDGESITRDPDLTGGFVNHTTATGSAGARASAGAQIDGTPFGGSAPAGITLTATAGSIDEGATDADLIQVSLTNASGASFPLDVTLTSAPGSEVTLNGVVSPTVQFQNESETIDVSVEATEDADETGNVTITVTATAAGFTDGTATFDVVDNEGPTVIAIEDFDGGTPSWSNDAAAQLFVDPSSSDQGLFIQTSDTGLLDNGSNVLFGRDLENESGETVFTPITIVFADVDVSGFSNVELTFDHALFEFDSGDEITYAVVLDRGLGGENLTFATGTLDGSDTGTVTVTIPGSTSTVGLELVLDQNGGSDFFELDNFQLTGDVGATPAIQLTTTAGSIDEGTSDADLVQVSLANASGQSFPLDVTLTAAPGSEVTLNGVASPTVQFQNDSETIDVSVEATEDGDFTGDVTITVTGTATGFSDGTATFDVVDNETPSIVINEIMFDPFDGVSTFDSNGDGNLDNSEDEFVEIVNTGAGSLDISGWTIEDANGLRHTFPGSTVLNASQAIIVFGGGTPTGFTEPLTQVASAGFLGLNNDGDSVILKNGSGAIVTQVDYIGGGDGESITRDPDLTGVTFVDHTGATGSGGARASVGTQIGGGSFAPPAIDLQITEIWPGQSGANQVTEEWFEITNVGGAAWVSGVDGALTYNGEDVEGITDIQPGEAVVIVFGDSASASAFSSVWGAVIDLTGVEVGNVDSPTPLDPAGGTVTLLLGGATADSEAYPDGSSSDGQSYDVDNAAFSVEGVDGAVATLALGGDSSDTPAVGSPGNGLPFGFTLTILHNNDGESSIFPDTEATLGSSPNDEFGGAATFVTLVDQEKAAATNPIMLSSGDNFLPGTVVDAGIAASGPFDPVVDYNAVLINEIGYDALAIGNHEFDLGPDFLADFIGVTTNVPFLSANLDFSAEASLQALVDSGRIAKSTILNVNGQQIGVIGAITEGLAAITNEGDVIIGAVEAAVEAEVASLLGAGVNKIILVSHLQSITEELTLIQGLNDVDVVIAGGGDEILDSGDTSNLLPSDTGNVFGSYPLVQQDEGGDDVLVVTTPGNYRYLGRLVIDFDAAGVATVNGSTTSELVRNARVDGLIEDPDTLANVVTPVEDFIATAVVVACSEVDLDTSRPNIRTIQTNMGSISADAFRTATEAEAGALGLSDDYIIALTNGGGIRTDRLYPAGDVTDQTINNIFPFGNEVRVVTGMTTAQLLSVLEHAVARVESVGGQWGHISGFTFSYDPSQPGQTTVETSPESGVFAIDVPGSRIVDVYMSDGTLIIDDGVITAAGSSTTYSFVTNNYILGNGDRYPLGTIVGDVYTEYPSLSVTAFGDFDGDGDTDYADVANNYLQNLPDVIGSDGCADITAAQYGASAVVNRIVAVDAINGGDLDGDGIDDAWEQLLIDFSGTDAVDGLDDVDGTTDFDGDGTLDLFEFQRGNSGTEPARFPQSIASGDPRPDSVVLWTRLVDGDTAVDRTVSLKVSTTGTLAEVGTDSILGGTNLWTGGSLTAQSAHDGVVKVQLTSLNLTGLAPDTRYYYQFSYNDGSTTWYSPIGRTRTAPGVGSTREIKYAAINCNDYVGRYFNVLKHLADQEADNIDFVLNLGDYIYETTGDPSFQTTTPERAMVFTNPGEAIDLGGGNLAAQSVSNYRDIYKTIRQDPQLQRVHELFPMISIWDDHEFSDDNWQDTATYFDEKVDETLQTSRKQNGEQVWMEFLPTERGLAASGVGLDIGASILYPNTVIYDSFSFGDNLDLILTDIRTFRPDHIIPEDAYPATIVVDETTLIATLAALNGLDVATFTAAVWPGIEGDFSPYVNIDDAAYASVKGTLQAILTGAVTADLASLPAGQTPATTGAAYAGANVTGLLDASFINSTFAAAGQPEPFDAAAIAAMDRGISHFLMGKTGNFSDFGSRYQVVNQTLQIYAPLSGRSQDLYGAAQTAFLTNALTSSTAGCTVIASSTPFTPILLELGDLPPGVSLPTSGLLNGDPVLAAIPDEFLAEFLLNADEPAGFPQGRQSIIDLFEQSGAIIVSGDIHAQLVGNNLASNGGTVVDFTVPSAASSQFRRAVETAFATVEGLVGAQFGGTFEYDAAQRQAVIDATDDIIEFNTPEMVNADTATHGYTVFCVGTSGLTADYRKISVDEIGNNLYAEDATTLDALFARESYDLTTVEPTVTGGSGGTVSGGGRLLVGETATFTATPDLGKQFVQWLVDGNPAGNTNPLEVTISAGTTIEAEFADAAITLTILHNNDGESSIFPDTDATLGSSPNDEFGGAATFVTLVDQEKAAATNPIMLSSGDNFLPGTVVDAGIAASGPFDPVVDYNAVLINEIGYDALAIGNHEFDLGPDFLADFIGVTTNVPFLSANLDFSAEASLQALVDSGRIAKSTILNVNGQQIGVIGAITEGLAAITNEGDVIIGAVEAAVEAEVASLLGAGVNKIILVSHLQSITEELTLIQGLNDVDVVIAGGGDEILDSGDTSNLLPSDTGNVFGSYPLVQQDEGGDDVLVVTTPGNYRYLGRLVIDFDAAGVATVNGSTTSELVRNARVDGLIEDPDTLANVVTPVEDFIATAVVVACSEVDLDTSRPNIRTIQTNMGSISADAFRTATEAEAGALGLSDDYIIALTNGGGIRTDRLYPAGDVTDQTINNIFPFGNEVRVVTGMTTAQLLSVLEHAVARVESVGGQWGHISGFTFSYDPSQPGQTTVETSPESGVFAIDVPGSRIVDVYMSDGTLIIDDGVITAAGSSTTYSFVTNNYILGNGDRYPLGTIVGDVYTEYPSLSVTAFGDFDGDGDTDYADVANNYLQNLPDVIGSDGCADITAAQYGASAVVNRIVAVDAINGGDLDMDGIDDAWEQLLIDFSGTDAVDGLDDVDGTTDFDGDGNSDLSEFQNLSNFNTTLTPTAITATELEVDGDFVIEVPGGTAGLKVTSSDDLNLPFTDVPNVTVEPTRFIIPAGEINVGRDFFRVEEE